MKVTLKAVPVMTPALAFTGRVDEAKQPAGRLDQTANARIAEALRLLPTTP